MENRLLCHKNTPVWLQLFNQNITKAILCKHKIVGRGLYFIKDCKMISSNNWAIVLPTKK